MLVSFLVVLKQKGRKDTKLRRKIKTLFHLLKSIGDTSLAKVIWGHLHPHTVAGQNLDEVHSHLARYMSQNLKVVFQPYSETCVRQSPRITPSISIASSFAIVTR